MEIENCLLAHPFILEVSAVGLKDKRYGEVVAVFVRKDEAGTVTQDNVREWVREKLCHHLGKPTLVLGLGKSLMQRLVLTLIRCLLVPKYVFFVTGYPKTASGKIQKFVLQEMGEQLVLEQAAAGS